jgi:hypothetical protein
MKVLGVGLWGPGLEGWVAARPVLAGAEPYQAREIPPPPPAILPATERRRAGPVVRLALTVAQAAVEDAGLAPATLRSIFASGNGDGPVVTGILDALARAGQQPRAVSPTQFHNSVHNAAAGYWCIAHGLRQPADCIGLHDDSFAAGLLKAAAEVAATNAPVLLVCYDHPFPDPLGAARPTLGSFGVGLVLAPGAGLALAHGAPPAAPSLPRNPALHALARGNPAARALPLLEALAAGSPGRFSLPLLTGGLTVTSGA